MLRPFREWKNRKKNHWKSMKSRNKGFNRFSHVSSKTFPDNICEKIWILEKSNKYFLELSLITFSQGNNIVYLAFLLVYKPTLRLLNFRRISWRVFKKYCEEDITKIITAKTLWRLIIFFTRTLFIDRLLSRWFII